MVLNPRVQRKAQEEIDSVIEEGRLPTIDDRPRMPYMRCVVTELLRWARSVPLGECYLELY